MLAVHWVTFFHSVQISTVAVSLISFSTFPIFVAFIEPYFFKEEAKVVDIITTILTFLGAILVVPRFDLSNNITQGFASGTVSAIAFTILSILNHKYARKYPSLLVALYQDGVATMILLPLLFLVHPSIQVLDLFLLMLLGVIFTAVAHTLFIKGMTHIKTQTAGIIASLGPLYGVLFALIVLREIPTIRTLVGGAIILGAVFYSSWNARGVR
jgi:drug/metabolite transporter (DMT)-like permease